MIGSDSIQFDYPQKAGLNSRELIQCLMVKQCKYSSIPDQNAADVSDCNFHFHYLSSKASTSADGSELSDSSETTSGSGLISSKFNGPSRTIHTLMDTKLNIINYSFDGEEEETRGKQEHINFSFT